MTLMFAIVPAVVLAAALYYQWQRVRNLRRQLQAAAADLEGLQNACARLAPAGVVQQLVADGIRLGEGPAA